MKAQHSGRGLSLDGLISSHIIDGGRNMAFAALETEWVTAIRNGGLDAYGNLPERVISDGVNKPCRHCLCDVPDGAAMLILSACPFPDRNAFAETGPIFLCADHCDRYDGDVEPPILRANPDYLVKGYSTDNRIVYGTGQITEAEKISDYCADVFLNPDVDYIHIRSARNNCYQCKVTR